jgi:glycosyltransferase involved in cell wall biosynthesis
MRIVIVGPTHPYKGGVSQHTTVLAHRLAERGDDVTLCSWASQYPRLLYRGEMTTPGAIPEIEPFPRTIRRLRWWWPGGWIAAGRACRRADLLSLVFVTPLQAPALLGVLAGAGRWRARAADPRARAHRPRALAVCHNVTPHETRRIDRRLSSLLLGRVDAVLTHSDAMAADARALTRAPVLSLPLPPHRPDTPVRQPLDAPIRRRVLFFGLVRPYKGVDLLVRALADAPGITATIAGEFWTDPDELRGLARELGVDDRIELRPGYVPATDIPRLFADADALVLPYRSGTASQNVARAHSYGVPVVASRVGSFPIDVRDGVDGLLCDPDDVIALAAALRHLYEPGVLPALRGGIGDADEEGEWARYVDAVHESGTRS